MMTTRDPLNRPLFPGTLVFRPVSGLTILLLTMIVLLSACQSDANRQNSAGDSSLINTAYAQTTETQPAENDQGISNSRRNAITRAVAKVSPAVVGINVTQVQRYVQRTPWSALFPELYRDRMYERKVESLGSGFIISQDGYIVTNEHVVEGATEIVVTLPDGRRLKAKLVGADRFTDIALLKIDGDHFPFIVLGRSDDLLVGEWVIALGNPFGLVALNDQPTVTVGVISAIDRDWGRTNEGRLYLDMIQTDAAINHGNSGGPLVNSLGQVIGMNTFIYTGSQYNEGSIGIGFAIPINKIREIIGEIREKGGVNREYWLGIYDVQSLTPRIVQALDLQVRQGVIITQIERGSPAYRQGMREYDVIVAVEGKPVHSRESFINVLRDLDLKVGTVLTFDVVREDRKISYRVTLESMPDVR